MDNKSGNTITNFLVAHWEKEYQVFQNNLAILKEKRDKTALHNIRVAVKQLRADISFFLILTKDSKTGYVFKETDKFFSVCGRQRDTEMSIDLLSSFSKEFSSTYPELKSHLRSQFATESNWTRKALAVFSGKELDDIGQRLRSADTKKITPEAATRVINKQLLANRKHYKKPHKFRQHLKEIYYWIKMLPETSDKFAKIEKSLHKILDDLGNWQDLQGFENKIKHFRKDVLPDSFDEYEMIKKLEAEVKKKSYKLLKSAMTKTRQL